MRVRYRTSRFPSLSACSRNHITQKVKIAGQRTLYLSVHDDAHPAEIFLRLRGSDCPSELIGLYDVIARLMSLALKHNAQLEKVGDLFPEAKLIPAAGIWKLSAGGSGPEQTI